MAPSLHEVRSLFLAAESRLSERFESDARRELDLLDEASSFLAKVIGAVPVTNPDVEVDVNRAGIPASADARTVRLLALKFLGIRAVRVVRAARAALATGYEPEVQSYDRVLVELLEHTDAVVKDKSGKAALDWLKGNRGPGVTGRVSAMGATDLYRRLSQYTHGDPRPVLRLIDASNTLDLGPQRTLATRDSLLTYAAACRHHAVTIAHEGDVTVSGLATLDARIHSAWDSLAKEQDLQVES